MSTQPVTVGRATVGAGHPLMWICGPCVIESHDLTLRIAEVLRGCADRLKLPLVFKASFDKANRTSGKSFRGPGLQEGLKTLEAVKRRTGLPVTTDIHESPQVAAVAEAPAKLALVPCRISRTHLRSRGIAGVPRAPLGPRNVLKKLRTVASSHQEHRL